MKKSSFERVNIVFPKEVAEELRKIPSGNRSRLVVSATEKALQEKSRVGIYERLLELRKKQKPLPAGTIVRWVREDRESH
ncbi:MAG: hypothetical protein A2Z11_02185 [Candidatus Woykebacteria bacterium RBG_16_43_9]|uniref:Ribbon-helix-helix protein CopG domain-containing protein n=1 Tax=Candidatus Woykebacteria bacterium RBG_16_43_9 TaxID=1802596 RepID=A0A1G1WGN5_9BACT|nr:MAG: hypothetical protein A2Z11_02185 [Candidatus Woykebacteria bacterium RBG_16_43_9]